MTANARYATMRGIGSYEGMTNVPQGKPQEKPATVPLSVRFSTEELELLRADAERAGVPVSTLVRRSALVRAPEVSKPKTTPSNGTSSMRYEDTPSTGIQKVVYSGGYSARFG